ncbi:Homeobox domain-like [Trinorchestia longiramus]|nr:Homeobox domain-like [Trinorchestia longiramus]
MLMDSKDPCEDLLVPAPGEHDMQPSSSGSLDLDVSNTTNRQPLDRSIECQAGLSECPLGDQRSSDLAVSDQDQRRSGGQEAADQASQGSLVRSVVDQLLKELGSFLRPLPLLQAFKNWLLKAPVEQGHDEDYEEVVIDEPLSDDDGDDAHHETITLPDKPPSRRGGGGKKRNLPSTSAPDGGGQSALVPGGSNDKITYSVDKLTFTPRADCFCSCHRGGGRPSEVPPIRSQGAEMVDHLKGAGKCSCKASCSCGKHSCKCREGPCSCAQKSSSKVAIRSSGEAVPNSLEGATAPQQPPTTGVDSLGTLILPLCDECETCGVKFINGEAYLQTNKCLMPAIISTVYSDHNTNSTFNHPQDDKSGTAADADSASGKKKMLKQDGAPPTTPSARGKAKPNSKVSKEGRDKAKVETPNGKDKPGKERHGTSATRKLAEKPVASKKSKSASSSIEPDVRDMSVARNAAKKQISVSQSLKIKAPTLKPCQTSKSQSPDHLPKPSEVTKYNSTRSELSSTRLSDTKITISKSKSKDTKELPESFSLKSSTNKLARIPSVAIPRKSARPRRVTVHPTRPPLDDGTTTREASPACVDAWMSPAGNPSSSSTAGNPCSSSTAGNPSSGLTAGNPSSSSTAGNPSSSSTAGNPCSSSTAGNPSSGLTAGNPSSSSTAGNPCSSSTIKSRGSVPRNDDPSKDLSSDSSEESEISRVWEWSLPKWDSRIKDTCSRNTDPCAPNQQMKSPTQELFSPAALHPTHTQGSTHNLLHSSSSSTPLPSPGYRHDPSSTSSTLLPQRPSPVPCDDSIIPPHSSIIPPHSSIIPPHSSSLESTSLHSSCSLERTSPSSRKVGPSPSAAPQKEWTKEEDLEVLLNIQEMGPSTSSFGYVADRLTNKTLEEVEERFYELLQAMMEEGFADNQ